MKEKVVVLGATPKEGRYAWQAREKLLSYGHTVILVNPTYPIIEGQKCYADVNAIPGTFDTLTVYVNENKLKPYLSQIVQKRPARVIFNPGAESVHGIEVLAAAGIKTLEACTLIMLGTNQFES